MEYRLLRHDGVYRWINDRGVPFYINNHEFAGYIGSCMDVTDKIEGQKMRQLAQRDGLTGTLNRQYFEQLGSAEFLRAKRFNTPLTITMIDIDGFKAINDSYGHIAGDLVLKEVAKAMSKNIRDFDLLGRFGGDEFIILMPNTNQSDASFLIERLDYEVRNLKIKYDHHEIRVQASFGVHELANEDKFDEFIVKADKLMYAMKKEKKLSL